MIEIEVMCPRCGDAALRPRSSSMEDGDFYEGPAAVTKFDCEMGHTFYLAISFHRGNTIMEEVEPYYKPVK